MRNVNSTRRRLQDLVRDEDGQDLIEYAFLAIFIALVVSVGLTNIGTALTSKFTTIAGQVSSGS